MTPASESELVREVAEALSKLCGRKDLGCPIYHGEVATLVRLVTAHNAAALRGLLAKWQAGYDEAERAVVAGKITCQHQHGLLYRLIGELRAAADKLEKGAPDGTDPR